MSTCVDMTGSPTEHLQVQFLTTAMQRVSRGLGLLARGSDGRDLAAEFHTLGGEAAMVRLPAVARMAWEGENAARQLGVGRDAYAACDHILRDLGDLLRRLSDATPVPANERSSPTRLGRIMVVDDSRVSAQAMADVFEAHGFDVRSATTLAAVEEIFQSFSPEVLVADVNMPEIDVADVCRRFRERQRGSRHAVVLVSGHTEAQLRLRLAQIQPDAFVCKMEGAEAVAARVAAFASAG